MGQSWALNVNGPQRAVPKPQEISVDDLGDLGASDDWSLLSACFSNDEAERPHQGAEVAKFDLILVLGTVSGRGAWRCARG